MELVQFMDGSVEVRKELEKNIDRVCEEKLKRSAYRDKKPEDLEVFNIHS